MVAKSHKVELTLDFRINLGTSELAVRCHLAHYTAPATLTVCRLQQSSIDYEIYSAGVYICNVLLCGP